MQTTKTSAIAAGSTFRGALLALGLAAALSPGLALAHGRGGFGHAGGWGHSGGFVRGGGGWGHGGGWNHGGAWGGGGSWGVRYRAPVVVERWRAPVYVPVVRPSFGWSAPSVVVSFGSPGWRSGRWYYGWHGTTVGWWWGVGSAWYPYSAPVYPYPAVAPAPAAQPISEPPVYYYCQSAQAYYPDVQQCAEGWQSVAAQPTTTP